MQLEKAKETKQDMERCRLLAQRIAEELAPATAAVLNAETPALEKALHRAGVDANPFTVAARQADLLVVEDPAWVEMPAQLPGQVLLVFTGSNVAEGWAEELARRGYYRDFRWRSRGRAQQSALYCTVQPATAEMIAGYEKELDLLRDRMVRAERTCNEEAALIERLRSDLSLSRSHAKNLEKTLNEVTSSTFWKLTWPMRYVVSKSRQIWHTFPLFVLLGIFCGLMSYYFTTVNARVGTFFKKIDSPYKKWLIGGAVLGILIYIFPPLYGEGYEGFMSLMHGNTTELFNNSLFYRFSQIDWVVILFIVGTMFFKVIAMASTNAAGGVGGTFAPSLFVGAFMGAITALVCNTLFGWNLSLVSFTLVGMSGVMSGVMKAPLTSIFLIAELSSGYGLFIPLMITACIAFAIDYYLDPDSIYTKQLRQNGELITHNKDESVFVFLRLDDLIQDDGVYIHPSQTLGDIVQIMSRERHDDYFPVLDNEKHLLGIVRLNDVREDLFNPQKYGNPITRYMLLSPDTILQHEQIQSVLRRFDENHVWVLPVVDKEKHYLGYISKSRIMTAYREQLVKISQ